MGRIEVYLVLEVSMMEAALGTLHSYIVFPIIINGDVWHHRLPLVEAVLAPRLPDEVRPPLV
jgi:hypothetical protein